MSRESVEGQSFRKVILANFADYFPFDGKRGEKGTDLFFVKQTERPRNDSEEGNAGDSGCGLDKIFLITEDLLLLIALRNHAAKSTFKFYSGHPRHKDSLTKEEECQY